MKGRMVGLMAVLVGLGMAVLIGCGGGKAPIKSTQQSISNIGSSSDYGTVTLSVQWPKGKGRVIPEATERIVARLKRRGMTLFEKVIERGQTQVVFEKVPVGDWVLEAEALGSGEEVVHAKGVVKVNNQPVAGAQVTLTAHFSDTGEQKTYTATTDDQGRFDFGLLKQFHGVLRVVASGYPEWSDWVSAWEFMHPEGLVIDLLLPGLIRKRQLGGGVTLASGATSFTLGANENKRVEVVLESRLSDLYVTPGEVRLSVNGEVDVSVQGLIEQPAEWNPNLVRLYLVPLSGDKVRWQIADSSVASLSSQTGLSVTVRGLKEGQTTLTVTDTESGKSKQVRVEVTQSIVVAKSIIQMLRDFGVSVINLPETEVTTINAALNEQQTVISNEIQIAKEFLDRIKFPKRVLGFDNLDANPSVFPMTASGQITTEVEGYVYNDLEGRPIPNATVDAYIGSQRIATTRTDSSGRFTMQLRISQTTKVTFVATSENFLGAETWRINPGEDAWVYIPIPQSHLLGLPPGKYREIWTGDPWLPRILERIGNAPDDKTWIVEVAQAGNVSGTIRSRQENEIGLVLTITVQNPIGIFRYTHEASKYTFQVRKPDDATIQYDGSITVTTDAQGNPTQIALSATVKDSKLSSPITFNGTLQGTPAQTGTVSGTIRSRSVTHSLAIAQRQRGRQSQGNSYAPYTEAKFVNVSLQSQFGNASVSELKVVWMQDTFEHEKIKQISLTGLTVRSQTSKPASLNVSSVSAEFRETTPQEKQLSPDVKDLTPTKATISATLEGSGIRLQVSNLQASDFKWVKVGERWDWWQYRPIYLPIPTILSGQISYSSPTVQFNGNIDAKWENPQSAPKDFGKEDNPVALAEVPKGTVKLAGNWAPNIGRPAGIEFQMTSNPQGNAPHATIQLTINYGDQKLSGTIVGTLDIRNNQSYGFKSGNLDMTHSPSNFKVGVSAERGKPVSGQIVNAQGQKVADIGEAKNLGLPDLGSALIVKYTDGTFETLESALPPSTVPVTPPPTPEF